MVSMTRAFRLGAYDYWIKPLHEIQFKSMRTHFLKKCVSEENTSQKETGCLIKRISDNSELASSMAHRSNNNNFEEDDDVNESINPPSTKKPRVVWEDKLHGAFLSAIQQIGIESMMCYFSLFINICISLLVLTVSLFFFYFICFRCCAKENS